MTLFHLLEWIGAALGLSLGAMIGHAEFGWVGGALGALVGAPLGWLLGRVPYFVARRALHVVLTRDTVDQLRARLRDRVMWSLHHLVMEELRRRGEDVQNELSVVLALLAADSLAERLRGWHMLRFFFPDVAAMIPDYDPSQPAAQCRARIERIRPP